MNLDQLMLIFEDNIAQLLQDRSSIFNFKSSSYVDEDIFFPPFESSSFSKIANNIFNLLELKPFEIL